MDKKIGEIRLYPVKEKKKNNIIEIDYAERKHNCVEIIAIRNGLNATGIGEKYGNEISELYAHVTPRMYITKTNIFIKDGLTLSKNRSGEYQSINVGDVLGTKRFELLTNEMRKAGDNLLWAVKEASHRIKTVKI